MRKAFISALSLSLTLSAIDGCPDPVQAQDQQAMIERVLNPLPEFDPFEKPPLPPQFFPDEVDKRARELLIDSLTNGKAAIEEHVRFFQAEDRRLQKQHGSSTGLAEHAQDLLNNTIHERQPFLTAQRQALKNSSSPERKKYLQAIIDEDDLTRADQLTRQSSVNELGGVFNRLLSSVDLVGVASGNYIGAAAETAIGQAYALLSSEMSVEERRALARHMDHLKRYPNDPRNSKIVKEIEELEKKKTAALVRKQLDHSKQAAQKGDIEKSLFYAEIASYLDSQSKIAQAELQKVAKYHLQQMERQNHGLSAQAEKAASAEQHEDQLERSTEDRRASRSSGNEICRQAAGRVRARCVLSSSGDAGPA
jgi:hypothetical protein